MLYTIIKPDKMNKTFILLVMLFVTSIASAQLKIRKSRMSTHSAKTHELVRCCTLDEDVVISIHKTNKSVRVSLQRNDIALSYQSYFSDFKRKKDAAFGVGTYGSNQFTFLLNEKKRELFLIYGDEFAYSVHLSWKEQDKLIKYLAKS